MKTLNERATDILQALLAVRAYRIDHGNGVYTRLRAAMIGRNGKYNLISLVEYYEAKGKLAQNTEMNFAFDTSTKQFIPYYYCNKTLRIESHSAYPTENGMENCAEERQADHTNFANRWLIRMNSQQPIMNAQRIVQNCVLKNQSTVIEEMIRANLMSEEYLYPFADDVMEWWLIDSWLAERLKEQGEVIIEEYGCYWWGRQSSGQAIYMDGVIQEICGED